MMYKVGDEVLIKAEVTDVACCGARPYFVAPDKYSVNWVSEDKIIPMDKTYEQGLADAWELAKKIDLFDNEERTKIFGYLTSEYIKEHYTVQEALAKIEAYEKEKSEIKVGDVIKYANNLCVVVSVFSSTVNALYEDGSTINMFISECKKTGKHIDIESLLKQIGE